MAKEISSDDDLILSQNLFEVEDDLELFKSVQQWEKLDSQGEMHTDIKNESELDLEFGEFELKSTCRQTIDDESEQIERFSATVTSEDIEKLITSQENVNTKKSTKWALNIFEEWRKNRPSTSTLPIPELCEMKPGVMDYWLQRFILEARKKCGGEYSPNSIYYIMCGLLRHLKDENIPINFLDENNFNFMGTRKALDAKMKEMLKKGLGCKPKRADPVSISDEDTLWTSGVFGLTDALSLQYTVFFYACKLFGLRGRDEHRNLHADQFELGHDRLGYFIRFTGRNNKTFSGGLSQLQLKSKDIKHYCTNFGGPRCIYTIFKTYLDAIGEGLFYRKSLKNGIRYGKQVVGVNKLGSFMKEMCNKAGLVGNFTNHSGKRTCATFMYQNDIPEQCIRDRTGHRSEEACRVYKVKSDEMELKVSSVLNPPSIFTADKDIATNEPALKRQKPEQFEAGLADIIRTTGTVNFHNCKFNFK